MKSSKIIIDNKENLDLQTKLEQLKKYKNTLEAQLNQITNSKAFKLWQIFHSIKKNPKLIKKGIKIFFNQGFKALTTKVDYFQLSTDKLTDINYQYQIWLQENWPTKKTILKQQFLQKNFIYRPKISIITPVYNPDKQWLEACIKSVINQTYNNWELCLADDNSTKPHVKEILKKYEKQDKRIKVVYRKQNGHISKSSNSALELATGEYIALLDHDDELAPNALYENIKLLNENRNADLIYSDEDKIEINSKHVDPFFKPDWTPDMFLSVNYICHLCLIRKSLIDSVGGFRVGYEGSQDYDLFLRIIELTKHIYHIPKILYSWRKIAGSTASEYSVKGYANQASITALSDALKRKKIAGTVENGLMEGSFRVRYKLIGKPLISIIIPTKDKVDYLKRCIQSILDKTTYKNYEILIIDTGSIKKTTLSYYKKLKTKNKIKILTWNHPFNYSTVNNFGVKQARGEYVLLLNNDTEIITPDWIESMLELAQRKEIGAVGVKLLYPNNKIQHAGIIIGLGGVAGHVQKMFEDLHYIPLLWNKDIIRNYSAVTAACLMISKKKFLSINGLDPTFKIAFNDVDFCLRLIKKGYLHIYTPHVKLYHHESISVGKPEAGTRELVSFQNEIQAMHNKWHTHLQNDPYYNTNLTLDREDYGLKI